MKNRDREQNLKDHVSYKEIERYRLAMESVNEGFWDWDLVDDEVYFSPSCYTMLGYEPYEPDSVVGEWLKYVHPDDRALAEEKMRRAASTMDYPYAVTFRMKSKNDGWRWIFSRGKVIAWDKHRKPLRMIGTNFDFTDRKVAEDRLRESERRLSTLMNNLPGMAYRCRHSPSRKLEYVSRGCKKLIGYGAQELAGENAMPFIQIVHPDDRHMVQTSIQTALADDKSFELVYRIVTLDGDIKWVKEQGEPIHAGMAGHRAVEGYIMDVTLQKEEEITLRLENVRLKSSIKERYRFGNIVGKSPAMQTIYELILQAAESNVNTIIYGESGTGKELVARAIHQMGQRRNGNFVVVNCAAIPETLLESEFFGYKKGAFTGATENHSGFLDAAHQGTLFLDEVGELPPAMQAKLLRVLEGYGYSPVGGHEVKNSDLRIVSATNRDLKERISSRKVREDFYYRIHILPIHLPPLRNRKEDIPLLIEHFLQKHGHGSKTSLPAQVIERLRRSPWPGNVRELFNVLHRYLAVGNLDFMNPLQAPEAVISKFASGEEASLRHTMENCEVEIIRRVLERNRWRRDQTAANLGISVRTLHRKMKQHKLE